jgi:hypothetical protein
MSNETGIYRFKPAPLRGAQTFGLASGVLHGGEDATGWHLPLADVTEAAFVQHRMGRSIMLRLDLRQGETLRRLAYNGAAKNWRNDPDAHVFLDLASAVMSGLEAARPGIAVTYGEYGAARWSMFAVGLAALVGGIGLFLAALATGVPADRLAAAAVPALLLVALGGAVGLTYAPWRKPPRIPASTLAPLLARHRGNT